MEKQRNKSKSFMVYEGVKESIISGTYPANNRLLISSVAQSFAVSEIPVREAFKMLVQEGFLVPGANTGFLVSGLSRKDIDGIFKIRIELESLAVREAVPLMTGDQISAARQKLREAQYLIDNKEFKEYWYFNRGWHFSIYECCNNEFLIRMLNDLFDFSRRYPSYFSKKEELEESAQAHIVILDAIERRNVDHADALIRNHTFDTYYHYLKRMEEPGVS